MNSVVNPFFFLTHEKCWVKAQNKEASVYRCFSKKDVLKNVTIFTGEETLSNFFKKRFQHRCKILKKSSIYLLIYLFQVKYIKIAWQIGYLKSTIQYYNHKKTNMIKTKVKKKRWNRFVMYNKIYYTNQPEKHTSSIDDKDNSLVSNFF